MTDALEVLVPTSPRARVVELGRQLTSLYVNAGATSWSGA